MEKTPAPALLAPPARRHSRRIPALVLLLVCGGSALGQSTTTSATDGSTPAGLTPGSPAGSYPLSGFDNVNLFNGNLSFRLPLLKVGGRGGAGHTVTLAIDAKGWRVRHTETTHPDTGDPIDTYIPSFNRWRPFEPGYGPGTLQARQSGDNPTLGCGFERNIYSRTLTRLTFTAADGTEYELRDQLTGGQPASVTDGCAAGASRGTVFVTSDGTSATFVSEATIYDRVQSSPSTLLVSGHLLLRDGTRLRVDGGRVSWLRDRNGNRVSFAYDANSRVSTITDSLNRQVTITYGVQDAAPYGLCDKITYSGFGGVARVIRVSKSPLADALRPGYALKYLGGQWGLFPELNGSSTSQHNPTVTTAAWLPDGRAYKFFYNSYGELARAELPTGGAVEYDAAPGSGAVTDGVDYQILRRVAERRVYGAGGALESKMTYTVAVGGASLVETTAVVADSLDAAGTLLARQKHYFHGDAARSLFQGGVAYSPWKDGREYKAEAFAADGTTVLRRTEQTWQQPAAGQTWPLGQAEASATAKSNDPQVTQTLTTLADTNQVSKQTFAYDRYNNQTDVYEYDFGAGAAGALVRRTHTDFVISAAYVDADVSPAVGAHLRALPSQTWVSAEADGTPKLSLTVYEYDNYSGDPADARHEPLVARAGITGHETAVYSTAFTRRGNVTGVTSYSDAAAQTGAATASAQYDVAGNVVKRIDARGNASSIGYADSFCNGAGCGGTSVANTYAFPTSQTSPVPDPAGAYGSSTALVISTRYDFRSGLVYSVTDANGQTTTFSYADALDRPTSEVRPDGGRTDVEYGDAVGNLYVRTLTDLDAARRTDSYQYFDGLGRPFRSMSYENQVAAEPWVMADTEYDALGRVRRTSLPYRAAAGAAMFSTDKWTETAYDALGRVTAVTTRPDNAVVATSYSGRYVTVTDQAGKARRSKTDALGRLTRVDEPDAAGALGTVDAPAQWTGYAYDAVGNLRKVTQGAQLRFFMYDSLGRLTRAKNPEQSVNASITGTDPVTGNSQWSFAYAYDAAGNLTSRTDPRNVTTTYTYDALNRNTSVSYTDSTPHVRRDYDTAANGLGLPRGSWTLSAAGTYYTRAAVDSYDAAGRPLARRQHFFTGGAAGPAFNVERTYDRAGNVLTQTYPSGRSVTYTYDAAGRFASFAGTLGDGVPRTYASSARYHEGGGLEQERFGTATPVYSKRRYNDRGQFSEVRVGTQSITSAEPGHWNRGAILNVYSALAGWVESGADNNGNLRKQMVFVPNDDAISGWWETAFFYDYDALNRLYQSREVRGGQNQWVQYFDYDRWGNRTVNAANTWGGAPEPQFTASATTNRLAPPSGYTMSYDAAGNLTADTYTGSGTRAYDAENRMTSAQFLSGQLQTAAYDGEGRRVKRGLGAGGEVWQVYGVEGELLAEYAAGSAQAAPLKEYGHRRGEPLVVAEPGAVVRWLVTDHLGTPRIILDTTGSLAGVSRHDYFPFGEELTLGRSAAQGYGLPDGVRERWATYERDSETGLDYAQARYYSSAQGRFASPDEFAGGPEELFDFVDDAADNPTFYADLTNPQSLNKYQYAYNSPVTITDPDGKCPICLVVAAAVIILTHAETVNAPRPGDRTYPAGDHLKQLNVTIVTGTVGGAILHKAGGAISGKLGRGGGRAAEAAERAQLQAERTKLAQALHKRELSYDPATRGFRPAEGRAGFRLEAQTGRRLSRERTGAVDFVDSRGRTYDLVGAGLKSKHFNYDAVTNQIVGHLGKADRVAVDVSQLNRAQAASLQEFVNKLPRVQSSRVIFLR
ncbi:MAG TPA: RHS repeat-associated core domain-containing protein [Pyrinomonadaceae bacterium]|nr:RHS repeat-associated core domain-containing protein [Pyrinomonadaceae bacterium]